MLYALLGAFVVEIQQWWSDLAETNTEDFEDAEDAEFGVEELCCGELFYKASLLHMMSELLSSVVPIAGKKEGVQSCSDD
jgi:hypothetical protein